MTVRIDKSSGELFLYGVVGDSWSDDSFTASDVLDALDVLGGKRALVRVNSPGGIADEGIAIYNALKRYRGGVDTVVDSVAASAASLIVLAGDKRLASDGSRVMIHRALTLSVGNAMEMRKVADTLETYDKSLVEIYSKYITGTHDEIMQLLTNETWYTAESAIAAGLATGPTGKTNAEPMMASWFEHAPKDLIARACNRKSLASIRAKSLKLASKQ